MIFAEDHRPLVTDTLEALHVASKGPSLGVCCKLSCLLLLLSPGETVENDLFGRVPWQIEVHVGFWASRLMSQGSRAKFG